MIIISQKAIKEVEKINAFPLNSQDPNSTSEYKIKPLWFSPEVFERLFSEQKNL